MILQEREDLKEDLIFKEAGAGKARGKGRTVPCSEGVEGRLECEGGSFNGHSSITKKKRCLERIF